MIFCRLQSNIQGVMTFQNEPRTVWAISSTRLLEKEIKTFILVQLLEDLQQSQKTLSMCLFSHCGEIPKWCFPESMMSEAGTAWWTMPFSYAVFLQSSLRGSLNTACRQPGSNDTLTCWAWVYGGLHGQRACLGHTYTCASACSFLSMSMVNLVPKGV